MMTKLVWQRLGKHNGVMVARRVPLTPAEEQSRLIAAEKLRQREARFTAPILDHEIPHSRKLERRCRSEISLGGRIEDIVQRRPALIERGGRVVAALKLLLYVSFEMDGKRQVSDGIWITLYRNPLRPRHLKATY